MQKKVKNAKAKESDDRKLHGEDCERILNPKWEFFIFIFQTVSLNPFMIGFKLTNIFLLKSIYI